MPDLTTLSVELDTALRKREIYAVYQPQVDVSTGSVVAVEGLCRWNRPGRDPVGPDVFIPLAERSGVIHDIGRFMLDDGLTQIDRWRERKQAVEVAVNVSPVQLTSDHFTEYLISQLSQRDLPGAPLTIEITESRPLGDVSVIVPRLQKLRAMGVSVSLDDFGAGHASLSQFEVLPLSEVKLDRSLMQGDDDAAMRTLERAVERARELGLRIVAEGIETQEHLERARALGADRVQGFLFAPPMSVGDIDALLAA